MKIAMGMALWGVFYCTPLFVLGDESTNTPVGAIPAPTSVPVTNQPSQVAPNDPNPNNQFAPRPDTTNQPPQALPSDDGTNSFFVKFYLNPLRKKAEAGDITSQLCLGLDYEHGTGVQKDMVEAVRWLQRAADQGNSMAQYDLGRAYEHGDGVQKDIALAATWFRKAADQGDPNAQFDLGMCYCNGNGVNKNLVESAKWWTKSADQGNPAAQACLGECYAEGTGVEKDAIEAAKWFQKSADQGDPDAQYILGVDYANGTGVEKDVSESVKWYRKAADQGYASAQYNLGVCFREGSGVDKDPVEAVNWFRKAADQGLLLAQESLGACYFNGSGVKKDTVESFKWYRKAADQGDARSQFVIGESYYFGNGVNKDPVEAVNWFRKSADQGDSDAQFYLGICCAKGEGVEKDVAEAAMWYRKAAEQGDVSAQGRIGADYLQGIGVIKNEVEGLAWAYVCSANGNELATKLISAAESTYSASIIEAARKRASEIQAEIASNKEADQNDSTPNTRQAISVANAPKASGSGAFISADGLVLTAAHVVQGASQIEVVTATGTFAATVVKIDVPNDIAVLKCSGGNFTPLPIAPSKGKREGATVFTVGFPNIQLQGFDPKLTKGEISSTAGFQDDPRQWQISVPIQPGNSGGPLCDENGNLIGIVESTLNPLTMAKVEGEIPQNVNYAVKSNYILPLLDDVQNLPSPLVPANGTKFEDTVSNVQKSVVLILVY
jgi:TPR repeat protein